MAPSYRDGVRSMPGLSFVALDRRVVRDDPPAGRGRTRDGPARRRRCGRSRRPAAWEVNKLAEIIAATVLCGELSPGSAVVAQEWVEAQDLFGRNRPERPGFGAGRWVAVDAARRRGHDHHHPLPRGAYRFGDTAEGASQSALARAMTLAACSSRREPVRRAAAPFLEHERENRLRLLTSRVGPSQPRAVEAIAALIEAEARSGGSTCASSSRSRSLSVGSDPARMTSPVASSRPRRSSSACRVARRCRSGC
jgi:hypothetical protein